MIAYAPDELARWARSAWRGGAPKVALGGVCQDTRALKPGDLYVAMRGDRFDGHDFLAEAFAKGAAGALVERDCEWAENPVLPVDDVLEGLWNLARGCRGKWTGEVVGITGSVGKTTVKEMCADVLSVAGSTHRTAGNYNNHIGLPLTMLAMPPETRYGVLEIGMNRPGEIEALSGLMRPDIAIITDICNAHRERFSSLEAIAREKMKCAESVPASGFAILDRDSEWFGLMRRHTVARVVTISFGGEADFVGRATGARTMRVDGFEYAMPRPGEHMMRNALRAIALGRELGMADAEIAEGLALYDPPPMRWSESEIHGVRFINDAYNANPLSMRASLRVFAELPAKGKKWAVVGGMRELGAVEEEEHVSLGQCIDGLGLDGVITVGELGKRIPLRGAHAETRAADAREAARTLKERVGAGDLVLLKASRGERLEEVLSIFKEI